MEDSLWLGLDDLEDLGGVGDGIVIEVIVIIVADGDHGSQEDVCGGVGDWVELSRGFFWHVISVA